jgi:hypothetical protein
MGLRSGNLSFIDELVDFRDGFAFCSFSRWAFKPSFINAHTA